MHAKFRYQGWLGDSILVTRNPEEGVSFEGRVDSVHNTSIKLGFDER